MIKEATYFILSTGIQQTAGLILMPFMVCRLEIAQYGQYKLFVSASAFLSIFFNLTLFNNITAYYPQWEKDKELEKRINSIFILMMGTGCLAFLFFYISHSLWIRFITSEKTVLIPFSITFLSFFISAQIIVLTYLRMAYKARIYLYLISISAFISVTGKITYLLSSKNIEIAHLLCIDILSLLCFLIYIFYFLVKHIKYGFILTRSFLKRTLKYGIPFIFPKFIAMSKIFFDRVVLNMFFGPEILGIYSYARRLSTLFDSLISSVESAWIPYVVRNYKDRFIVKRYTRNFIITMGFFGIVLYMLSFPFTLFFAKETAYYMSLKFLPFLLILKILFIIKIVSRIGVQLTRKSSMIMLINVIGGLVYIPALLIFGSYFGIAGIIAALILLSLTESLLYNYFYKTYQYVYLPLKEALVFIGLFLILAIISIIYPSPSVS